MSDLGNYFHAQTETQLAMANYNLAGTKIELCKIKERRAECISQHLPLGNFQDKLLCRAELIKIINYVVCGREIV